MSEIREEILEQFVHLHTLLHRCQMKNFKNFGPWGNPHRGQGRVLSILKMKPEISQKELTYLLDMSRQALAELLSKLEKNGYIERKTSEEDRRSFNIKLTEKGAAAAGKMDDDTSPELDKVFDCLSDEELSNLSEYLKRIIEGLQKQFGGDNEDFRKQMLEKFMEHGHHLREHGDVFFGGGFHHGWCGRHDKDMEKERD
ncbi:MarR family winged helix-turn-helix transcriptional regulator [Clostridium sp. MT-14]|jgi:DNA-binding MarR family transcriptional regulator|uniref:MarR family winged helix-turn-helix transcriptional regulator n=1 Tax=unclassified Clostridium TaxID=2614128 RepID=UPI00123A512E|nr:MarR family transcriptional regulator [Clostridium sp. HV4-5-A1G]KAA8680147.1 MarR family transcriptional regulator [Clostridium sp. HV4-5-A1G]CAB1244078.1 Transcriptional regulator SlyA [Clostridiaceae bacterium BL-3]